MENPKPDTQAVKVEENAADEYQDSLFLSIRRTEALRELAGDITPLQADGSNLKAWVDEIDEILGDLIDREKYLQSAPPVPLSRVQDKVARSLIYRTIPRELRFCLRDAPSAHAAYSALSDQFLRNTRTAHMSALVDLFNFRMEVSEAGQVSVLYDQIYKGLQELVASGFAITQDALLGALFQIALGRSNLELYSTVSQYFDGKMGSGNKAITSREIAAVARMQLENATPIMAVPDEVEVAAEPTQGPAEHSQTFAGGIPHPARQATEPNAPAPNQQTAEPNVNMNHPHSNLQQQQHSSTPQHAGVPKNSSQPAMQPYIPAAQQSQGHLADESARAHIHPPVAVNPNLPNHGPDPSLVFMNNYPNVWANQQQQNTQLGPQLPHPSVPVYRGEVDEQLGLKVSNPGVPVYHPNPAPQPLAAPKAAPAPATQQAVDPPETARTLNQTALATSASHPLASSSPGAAETDPALLRKHKSSAGDASKAASSSKDKQKSKDRA
ncbi:hypothetical protein PCANC_01533 [Puccinia coronata f. sp. avenae]|uniref:Uncharacterized protein n=1 Tax=Puccinia coronata f. sp. avenae TaxID=200324 RepID=A0A2N5SC03_9BASI|nr:hypothetical protein PCASD_21307 [Puccinia coronata f. sp. avenae]PLW56584.1 hypothetical protein PCANC_01533 [Puccinia coronata f. sp. avenae]